MTLVSKGWVLFRHQSPETRSVNQIKGRAFMRKQEQREASSLGYERRRLFRGQIRLRDNVHYQPDHNLKAADLARFLANFFFPAHGESPPARAAKQNLQRDVNYYKLGPGGGRFRNPGQAPATRILMLDRDEGKKIGAWRRRWTRIRLVLYDSLQHFFAEDSLTVSASIAYYMLLSIFPLMLLMLSLSSIYIRHYELSARLGLVLERYLPMDPDFIMRNLGSISQSFGRVSTISILLLWWSSSGVFLPLEKALNRAWGVPKGRPWWRRHLLGLEMTFIVTCLIFATTALVGINQNLHQLPRLNALHPASGPLDLGYHALVGVLTFGTTTAMFVVLFQRLPNRPMSFRQVIPSALVTALFWEAARSLFTLLLPFFNYRHVYGSIGVVVALMTWVYASSVVTLFGAQVSSALYRTLEAGEATSHPAPAPAVQPVEELR
jgi:membrane protein